MVTWLRDANVDISEKNGSLGAVPGIVLLCQNKFTHVYVVSRQILFRNMFSIFVHINYHKLKVSLICEPRFCCVIIATVVVVNNKQT